MLSGQNIEKGSDFPEDFPDNISNPKYEILRVDLDTLIKDAKNVREGYISVAYGGQTSDGMYSWYPSIMNVKGVLTIVNTLYQFHGMRLEEFNEYAEHYYNIVSELRKSLGECPVFGLNYPQKSVSLNMEEAIKLQLHQDTIEKEYKKEQEKIKERELEIQEQIKRNAQSDVLGKKEELLDPITPIANPSQFRFAANYNDILKSFGTRFFFVGNNLGVLATIRQVNPQAYRQIIRTRAKDIEEGYSFVHLDVCKIYKGELE
jgi:hypothetical protein